MLIGLFNCFCRNIELSFIIIMKKTIVTKIYWTQRLKKNYSQQSLNQFLIVTKHKLGRFCSWNWQQFVRWKAAWIWNGCTLANDLITSMGYNPVCCEVGYATCTSIKGQDLGCIGIFFFLILTLKQLRFFHIRDECGCVHEYYRVIKLE